MANNVIIFPSGVTGNNTPRIVFSDSTTGQMAIRYGDDNELHFSSTTDPDILIITPSGVTAQGVNVTLSPQGVWAGETRMINENA